METSEKVVQNIEDVLREHLQGCMCDVDTFGKTDSSEFMSYDVLACKLFDVFRAYYEVPAGLLEIRGTAKKYTAEGGKELQITVCADHNLDNLMTLARMGAGARVTLRGLQSDLEVAADAVEKSDSDDHPDQMHIEDAVEEQDAA